MILIFILLTQVLILMTTAELAQGLTELHSQLSKATGEITAKIAALEQAIIDAGSNVPQSVVDAFEALKPAAQTLDDIVPDVES